jgi:transposase
MLPQGDGWTRQTYDRQIRVLAAASEPARRLMQVEAIGPQTATALVASVGDPHVFKNGRSFAAWLGITPRQHSSGGKDRLWRITHQGNSYLRTLLLRRYSQESQQVRSSFQPAR